MVYDSRKADSIILWGFLLFASTDRAREGLTLWSGQIGGSTSFSLLWYAGESVIESKIKQPTRKDMKKTLLSKLTVAAMLMGCMVLGGCGDEKDETFKEIEKIIEEEEKKQEEEKKDDPVTTNILHLSEYCWDMNKTKTEIRALMEKNPDFTKTFDDHDVIRYKIEKFSSEIDYTFTGEAVSIISLGLSEYKGKEDAVKEVQAFFGIKLTNIDDTPAGTLDQKPYDWSYFCAGFTYNGIPRNSIQFTKTKGLNLWAVGLIRY